MALNALQKKLLKSKIQSMWDEAQSRQGGNVVADLVNLVQLAEADLVTVLDAYRVELIQKIDERNADLDDAKVSLREQRDSLSGERA